MKNLFEKIVSVAKSHKENLKTVGAIAGAVVGVIVIAVAMVSNGSDSSEGSESDEDLSFGEQNE